LTRLDLVRPRPFLELQGLFDGAVPHGWHYYWKSLETPPLTNGTIDVLVDHTARITSPRSFTIVFHLGGALARVPQDATAYPQRDATFDVNITTAWLEGDQRPTSTSAGRGRSTTPWSRTRKGASTSTSSATRGTRESVPPTARKSTCVYRPSSAAGIPRTSSTETRTSPRSPSRPAEHSGGPRTAAPQ